MKNPRLRDLSVAFAVLAFHAVTTPEASAEPRFAARTAATCSLCHVNPTGGGMRNRYGRSVFTPAHLASLSSETPWRFDGQISETFTLGADFRIGYIDQLTRRDSTDPLPATPSLFATSDTNATFAPMQASLYAAAEVHSNVSLYADLSSIGALEAWALLHSLPAGLYVKAGMFAAPYGLRLADHTASVRGPLGFGARARDAGIEIGVQHKLLEAAVAFQNGEATGELFDRQTGQALSGRAAWIVDTGFLRAYLGGSAYVSQAKERNGRTTTDLRFGPFIMASLGPVTYVGEAAWRHIEDAADLDLSGEPTDKGPFVTYQSLSYLISQGFEAALSHEFMDRNTEVDASPSDSIHRYGAKVTWFPVARVQADVLYRFYTARANRQEDNQQEILGMAHLFF